MRKKKRSNPFTETDKTERRDHLELEGTVSEVFAGGHFLVELDAGPSIKAVVSGRMRRYRVRVLLGDRVKVALSPYDLTHGLITYRTLNRQRRAA